MLVEASRGFKLSCMCPHLPQNVSQLNCLHVARSVSTIVLPEMLLPPADRNDYSVLNVLLVQPRGFHLWFLQLLCCAALYHEWKSTWPGARPELEATVRTPELLTWYFSGGNCHKSTKNGMFRNKINAELNT